MINLRLLLVLLCITNLVAETAEQSKFDLNQHGEKRNISAKGQIVPSVSVDSKDFQEFPASPANGYHWPYFLFIPTQLKIPYLLVVPNNTDFPTEDLDNLRSSAFSEIQNDSKFAERLGCPVLMPLFPGPASKNSNLDVHSLNRESLLTTVETWKRVDLQLLQMVRSAQLYLENRNFRIHDRILLYGFSLAGDFVNRFTMLHPDRVLAVAGGGIAWPIVPTGEFEKEKLRYPIGLADIEAFTGKPASLDSLRSVAWFFFRGSEDRKDSVDYRDCYAEADAELIRRRFGPTPAARWPAAERLYAEERLSAWLVIYPRVGHRLTPEIQEDIVHFFEQRLRAVRGTPVPPGSVDW